MDIDSSLKIIDLKIGKIYYLSSKQTRWDDYPVAHWIVYLDSQCLASQSIDKVKKDEQFILLSTTPPETPGRAYAGNRIKILTKNGSVGWIWFAPKYHALTLFEEELG